MTAGSHAAAPATPAATQESGNGHEPPESGGSAAAVLRNRPFLLLWLSQLSTQIGVNMVLYALTVVVLSASNLTAAVSGLFLTFLVPSVLLSALAGVYVDRIDRRTVLVVSNGLRAAILVAIFAAGNDVGLLLLLNTIFSIVTVFFAPAEAAMIPVLVPREQLVAANGIFTLTLNGAFALGYALLAPLVVTIGGGPQPLIILVAMLFGLAAIFCLTLPSDPPIKRPSPGAIGVVTDAVTEAGAAVGGVFSQLREGIGIIRDNRTIAWSLAYLGISASLIGVVAVLGPSFARDTLGLSPKDLIVVVLPLGLGIVMGVLLLNNYGKYIARRRAIELGLVILGVLLLILTVAGPLSRVLTGMGDNVRLVDLSMLTSLVAVVVALAFLAGICYGIVAISAQVQLQEDIPPDGRGRVFGVLNMLISVASILPIIVVGQIADWFGTTPVILAVAAFVFISGAISIVVRGPIRAYEGRDVIHEITPGSQLDPTTANLPMPQSDVREPHGHSHREAHLHGEAHRGGEAHHERSETLDSVSRVAILFTGGTISMVVDAAAGGKVPTLDGAAILARAPGIGDIADLVAVDLGRTPASHFTFPKLFEIGSEIRRWQADPSIDGVVVVQGTDVIEETAFLWDLVLDGPKPVIVTGAMRAASDANDDGPDNLRNAVRCAAAPALRGAGVLVVLDGTINPADAVTKTHASALDTFQCLDTGPLGHVHDGRVIVDQERRPRRHVATERAADDVALLIAHVAMDGSLIDAAAALGPPGIVVEATGAGNTAAGVVEAAARAIGQGIEVAFTTRCPAGAASAAYAFPGGGATWARAGAILTGHLTGPKARVALALGLGAGLRHAELAELLADPPGWGPAIERAPLPPADSGRVAGAA